MFLTLIYYVMKVLTIHDLEAIKKRAENALLLREQSNEAVAEQCCGLAAGTKHLQILICGGTGCKASASHVIAEKLQQALEKNKITDQVNVITTGCFGFCEKGPIVKIIPDNTFYTQVTPEDAEEIVSEHIIGGRKIERLLYVDPKTEKAVSDSKHMDFYRKQMRIALRNCGFIDPENIEEYIGLNGYRALADSLLNGTPEAVIEEIKRSGLRGRGGGGFPTGRKWELASRQQADTKYVVCNADEGDPGAFMDRSIMEGDPHSIVEAMALCGYSIGSSKGLVYIRAEYPLAIQRLKTAIAQAREYGLLGDNIFGTGFCFDIEIRYGAGAFVCGEETALIHSMEGKRGEPTLKPPFPAESGYLGKPTNVNNVETLANIPIILTRGAEWFSTIGTEFSKGTKVFALAGKINNVGLIEVPMGTTLREVIYEIGGGIKGGKKFKAVQTGGPSGGCLTEKHLDTPIDFDNLLAEGSMMGFLNLFTGVQAPRLVTCEKRAKATVVNRQLVLAAVKTNSQFLLEFSAYCEIAAKSELIGMEALFSLPLDERLQLFYAAALLRSGAHPLESSAEYLRMPYPITRAALERVIYVSRASLDRLLAAASKSGMILLQGAERFVRRRDIAAMTEWILER